MSRIESDWSMGKPPERGLLVSFDGIDGSGKTTTIRRVRASLRKSGYRVHVFKLPSSACKQLDVFRLYKEDPFSAERERRVDIFSMFLVVAGDRLNTIRTRILPLLERGRAVLVDRYLYSALCEVLISSETLTSAQRNVIGEILSEFPKPHAAVFNRASFIEARKRIHAREDERDAEVDPILFNQRIDTFERLRVHASGVLVDTALDDHSCFKIVSHHLAKVTGSSTRAPVASPVR